MRLALAVLAYEAQRIMKEVLSGSRPPSHALRHVSSATMIVMVWLSSGITPHRSFAQPDCIEPALGGCFLRLDEQREAVLVGASPHVWWLAVTGPGQLRVTMTNGSTYLRFYIYAPDGSEVGESSPQESEEAMIEAAVTIAGWYQIVVDSPSGEPSPQPYVISANWAPTEPAESSTPGAAQPTPSPREPPAAFCEVCLRNATTLGIPHNHYDGTVAVAEDTALFAGGATTDFQTRSAVVDIYDNRSGAWATASLSQARNALSGVSLGDIAMFAGGTSAHDVDSRVVDIYNSRTRAWSVARLSEPRHYISAVAVGTKVIFAGGWNVNRETTTVDIYDNATNVWSSTRLSRPTSGRSGVSMGGHAFFAGGTVVDIYDSQSGAWSTAELSDRRFAISPVAVDTKVVFAGGLKDVGASAAVDIYDTQTNTWSVATLSDARGAIGAVAVGPKAIFAGGWTGSAASATVDIYDSLSNTWSASSLPRPGWGLEPALLSDKVLFKEAGGGTALVVAMR